MKAWTSLPTQMQNEAVKSYYDHLRKKPIQLWFKRLLDIVLSILLMVLLSPVILIVAILIRRGSEGPVIYKQIRMTQYLKTFEIYKFRTMKHNSEGLSVTVDNDMRITRVGRILRKYRLDEIPQLMNILKGEMTFVGTRPEVEKYVSYYKEEMYATFLMPAGLTSQASIIYKNEGELLSYGNVEMIYVHEILPKKMAINLAYLKNFNILNDLKMMLLTILEVGR